MCYLWNEISKKWVYLLSSFRLSADDHKVQEVKEPQVLKDYGSSEILFGGEHPPFRNTCIRL